MIKQFFLKITNKEQSRINEIYNIAGCQFFISNQPYLFSIAEALKVKRLLEVCFQSPNLSVEGIDGFDFCYLPQFENLVEKFYYSKNQNNP